MQVQLSDNKELKAHKFVLDARSKNWDSQNLSLINKLDLRGFFFYFRQHPFLNKNQHFKLFLRY